MSKISFFDRDWKYDLGGSFDYIINRSNSRINRAICLYQLQTALLIGRKLRKSQIRKSNDRENWINVSRSALLTARSISSMRLLEYMTGKNYSGCGEDLLEGFDRDRELKRLLQKMNSSGAARRMAYCLSWRQFDRLLQDTWKKQETYAPLYHVSLHFALQGLPGSLCPWVRAETLLKYTQSEPEYEIVRKHLNKLQSESTLYKYKPRGHHFAVFIWLDHFGGGYLRPERPISANFSAKLLEKVDDISSLQSYLGQYAHVRAKLVGQGYDLPMLHLAAEISPQNVKFEPLPDELTCLI